MSSSTSDSSLLNNQYQAENQNNFFCEVSQIFNENIERVWLFMRNSAMIPLIDPSFISQTTMIKGTNTWTVGNEYKAYWIGVSTYTGKCVKAKCEQNYKCIEWELNLTIGIKFLKYLYVYSISDTNSTLAVVKLLPLNSSLDDRIARCDDKKFYSNLYNSLLTRTGKFIKKSSEMIFNYESAVINKDFETIWDFVTDFNKISTICDLSSKNFEYKGDRFRTGTFIKGELEEAPVQESRSKNSQNRTKSFDLEEKTYSKSNYIYLRVNKVECDPNSNLWSYKVETFGTNMKCPKQEFEFKLLKITQNECQVSFLHNFRETVPKNIIAHLSEEKKKFLIRLNEMFS